jgi:hypothetical protein
MIFPVGTKRSNLIESPEQKKILPALLNAHQIAKMGVHQFEAIQKLVG